MRNLSIKGINRIEKWMLALISLLVLFVLLMAMTAENVVDEDREKGNYRIVEQVTMNRIESDGAPTGVVDEYRFQLEEIRHADTLMFYVNHHNVRVYLDEKLVYSVQEKNEPFHTSGGIWAMIPVYISDSGKEFRVELSPLYSNYQEEDIEFLIGSRLEIYQSVFLEALPELFLSLCVFLTGIVLLCLAIYYTFKKNTIFRLYSIAFLALFASIWRFTYGSSIYLLFPEHSVTIYTLSVISLMVIALSMLGCVDLTRKSALERKTLRYTGLIHCGIYIAQLVIQLSGIADLRQMLPLTHLTLITSALLLFSSGFFAWLHKNSQERIFLAGIITGS